MRYMNDLRGTIASITKNVTKTSGDLLKTTKLNINLSNEESNLKNLYIEIGKKVHEIYLYGGSLGKFFDEKYRELDTCERKIAEIKEQIGVIKGTRECPKCGKSVERTAEFCQKCGTRQDISGIAAPGAEAQQPIPMQEAYAAPETTLPIPELPPPMPEPTPPMEATDVQAPAPAARVCRICKSQNEPTTKFCLSCGRILD